MGGSNFVGEFSLLTAADAVVDEEDLAAMASTPLFAFGAILTFAVMPDENLDAARDTAGLLVHGVVPPRTSILSLAMVCPVCFQSVYHTDNSGVFIKYRNTGGTRTGVDAYGLGPLRF